MARSLAAWAEQAGCEIVEARSGPDALCCVLQHEFAVILLDVTMPGMNGYETAKAIHGRRVSASVPSIFVTAFHADELNRLQGYALGAVDYLFTPVIPQILLAKVAVFVALARQNSELKKQAAELYRRAVEQAATNRQLSIEIEERQLAVRRNEANDEFLAMFGHNLRNPPSASCTAIAVLNFPSVSDSGAGRTKKILQRQNKHLTRIVDDLLDLNRLRSGKVSLNRQQLALHHLVEQYLETLSDSGRIDQFTLKLDIVRGLLRIRRVSNRSSPICSTMQSSTRLKVKQFLSKSDVVSTTSVWSSAIPALASATICYRIFLKYLCKATDLSTAHRVDWVSAFHWSKSWLNCLTEQSASVVPARTACGSTFAIIMPAIELLQSVVS